MKEKINRYNLILIGIVLFFISANIIWLKKDDAPPMWDQAHYLLNSEILYYALTDNGLIAFLKSFTEIFQIKAPLITILPFPFYILFGKSYDAALYVNAVFILMGSYYLFKLGKLIAGEKEALLSIFILNTFPIIFGISREFLVEYGLMVFVVMWMYYLLKSNYLEDKSCVFPLGITLGLGMLMKITFALFIISPTFFIFIKGIIERKISKTSIRNIIFISVIGTLIAGLWYFKNLPFIINFAFQGGFGDIASYYSGGNVFSIRTVLLYWLNIINKAISVYFFFLIIILIAFKLFAWIKSKPLSHVSRSHFYFLLIWIVLPFVVFTFAVNKDYRYPAPLYPAIALLISIPLIQLSSKKYGAFLFFILLLFPIYNYLYISFSPKNIALQINELVLFNNHLSYAHRPIKESWPNRNIVKFLYTDALKTNNNNARATLLFNHPYLNFINLSYYAKNSNYDIVFNTNDFFPATSVEDTVTDLHQSSDYIIVKSDKLGPDFTNVKNIPVISLLNKGVLPFQQIVTIPLPDGSDLTIYKRTLTDIVFSGIEKLKHYQINRSKSINFSDKMRLLDFKIGKTKKGYTFTFFWECIDSIDLNYKIFVHIKDLSANPIAYADHYPTKSRYPTYYWKKGEIIKDEVDVITPLPSDFQVYSGVYEESIGVRLYVKDKPVNHPDNINGVRIY